ncbi:MAG: polymerase sigma-70 factor, subfamily [Actinomycetota bacterium]|nr:polymerase sigma-70 factor, subfamily [Actinomycetota bacterium]
MTAMTTFPLAEPCPSFSYLQAAGDRELAELSQVHAEAFGVLYGRYSRQIYRMVYHRLRDQADAEDVTAEVFVKALRAIDGYRPARAPFWGWLHRIAANAVIDHVRARRPTVSLAVVADAADASTDVEASVIGRSEAMRAWVAVARLCPTQRTAVTLRLAHDLPIAEIARRMDRSEGAVKQLINRGLGAVRLRLAEEQKREQALERPRGDVQLIG